MDNIALEFSLITKIERRNFRTILILKKSDIKEYVFLKT